MKNKKCKFCQSEIDNKAKVCPNCKKDLRNWFAKHPIITVILILLVVGMMGSSGSSSPSSNTNTQEQTTKESQEKVIQEPQKVKAFEIADDFDSNQVAAEEKWKGKYIEISAKITNITESGLSFSNIASKDFSMTQISCRTKDKQQLLTVKNGQTVTVRGTVGKQSIGVIEVSNCEIVK